jgi:hypothetical protein
MGNKPLLTLPVRAEIKPANPDWYPPCFETKEKYADYIWTVAKVGQPMDCDNYCMDCTHEYKIDMLKEKRCEHPETIFVDWRTLYRAPEVEGRLITNQDEADVIGISNVSKFWSSPLYD